MQISKMTTFLALAMTLALSAAACGSSSDGDEANSADSSSSASELASEPASEEAASEGLIAVTVGIANMAPLAALLLVEEGFQEALGACEGLDVTYVSRNAEGDGAALGPIIAQFLADDVDLMLAISTPVLQATVSANEADGRETPVLFGAVTDPYAAGAAVGPDDKPDWLTGWQADAPVEGMFDAALEINPGLSVIGVAYDPSQVNSEKALERMQAEADARGITVETATIGDSSEVGTASQALAAKDIDMFFVPTDSILVNGLAGMLTVADDFDIPVIAQDSNITKAGAAIGTGLDYRGDGVRNGEYACQILKGEKTPADFPIQQFEAELIAYNSGSAEDQGFEVPESIKAVGVDNG